MDDDVPDNSAELLVDEGSLLVRKVIWDYTS